MKTTHTTVSSVPSHRRMLSRDPRGHASRWVAALLIGIGVTACTSTPLQVKDAALSDEDSPVDAVDEAVARRCAIQVGSAHPRGVVVQSAFARCVKRREASRIGAMLRALEKGR